MLRSTYWYDVPTDTPVELAHVILDTCKELAKDRQRVLELWRENVKRYLDVASIDDLDSELGMLCYDLTDLQQDPKITTWVSWNFCRSMVDSLVAKLSLNPPVASFGTRNGSEAAQQRARDYESFTKDEMRETGAFAAMRDSLRLRSIFGTSFVVTRPCFDDGTIDVQSIGPDRVLCDSRGKRLPRSVFVCTVHEGEDLIAAYGSTGDKDKDAAVYTAIESAPLVEGGKHRVVVIEAFAFARGDKPGRRVVCTKTGVLEDVLWESSRHRIAHSVYTQSVEGLYGQSLIDQVIGCQREINLITEEWRGCAREVGKTYIRKRASCRLPNGFITDTTRNKIIDGEPDDFDVKRPEFQSQSYATWLEMNIERIAQLTGLNLLTVSAQKPAGLDSGKALLVLNDTQTQRFADLEKGVGEEAVKIAKALIQAGTELVEAGAFRRGRHAEESIPYGAKDIDDFTVEVAPRSSLPDDPAGRQQALSQAMRDGLITREEARQQMGFLDLEKAIDLDNAPKDLLEYEFETMLAGGEYQPPDEQMMDLETGIALSTRYWSRARRRGDVEDSDLEKLRRWVQDAASIIAGPPPEVPQQAPPISEQLPGDPAAAMALAQAQGHLAPPAAPPMQPPGAMPV